MKINELNTNIAGLFKKVSRMAIICSIIVCATGCNDFLDVVPDNIANMDHVFANKKEAERYMATLYSYVPVPHRTNTRTLTFFGADDVWTYEYDNNYNRTPGLRIARGEQNVNSPYENYWDGNMFKAIRDCNIFIEEMSKPGRVPELDMATRMRWISEAKFLKAYYHFILFRMYGPIPVIRENLSIGSSIDEVAVEREPVDDVVNYLSTLLDEAAEYLPLIIENTADEAGRLTKGAAYMLKAKLWVTAASPLFNGNPDYKTFTDKTGTHLFPQQYEKSKWDKAVVACEEALANIPGVELYKFMDAAGLNKKTQAQMNLRGAVTDRFNREIIWGRYMDPYENIVMQAEASVPQMMSTAKNSFSSSCFSVTLNMVERFYSKNGVPINEDKTWDYGNRYNVAQVGADQKYNLIEGYTTAIMNQNRENRFYGSLMFDGCVVYMKNTPNEENAHKIQALYGDQNGVANGGHFATVTGYWIRKIINWEYTHSDKGANSRTYSWPEMRLADLKLLYAEALNEVDRRDEAIRELNDVRARVGLDGVKESWSNFSTKPNKPDSQDGLREIIHQEREIELAFEGHRIWDIRRWKKAEEFQNSTIKGWNVMGRTPGQYYQVNTVYEQTFVSPRDYLWPISLNTMLRNPKLVQNPGWN